MNKWIIACSLMLALFSCSLTATQETNFNAQSASYLKAVNGGLMLKIITKTHPSYVKHIKAKGDEIFKKTFSKKSVRVERVSNIEVRQIKQKYYSIQIAFMAESKDYFNETIERKPYVAISENNGLDWYFIPYKVWKDKNIFLKVKRLF